MAVIENNDQGKVFRSGNDYIELAVMSVLGDRDDQQDSFGYSFETNEGAVVVCDGMGGHEGGRVASMTAVKSILDLYENDRTAYPDPGALLIEATKIADARVAALTHEDGTPLRAGSTQVAVIIKKRDLYWVSVGDSRAYLFRNGEKAQFTKDQTYKTVIDEKMRAGLITAEEYASESARAEALISYLGIGSISLIDYNTSPFPLAKDDRVIIMSDGLYKLLSDDEIFRVVDNFTNVGEALSAIEMKAKKKAKSGAVSRDNMTVALLKIK